MSVPRIEFDEIKNLLLKETRGINFDDAIDAIEKNDLLDDLKHHNPRKYPDQRILVVKIDNYAYAVPYIINKRKNNIYLKTIYPSRILTKKYLKEEG